MYSLFLAKHLCNFTVTVCIGQAAAYWKTCEASGTSTCNVAFTLINLYQLLDREWFKFKYNEFKKKHFNIMLCVTTSHGK